MKKLLTLMFILLIGAGLVYSQTITVTSPNGGQNWELGSTHNVTWTSSGVTGNVGIKLFLNGASLGYVAENIAVAAGTYSWTITNVIGVGPISAGTTYQIQVKQSGVAGDLSDANFEISSASTPAASIEVTSPNSALTWKLESTHNVTWTSSGITGNVGIKLFQGGSSLGYVGQNVPNTGTYSWTISSIIGVGPISTGSNYKIQVKKDGVTGDLSDVNFTIDPADDGGSGPGIDPGILERLKDLMRRLREIKWWRGPWPGPGPGPGPGPCLSCPPYFDLGKLRELLAQAGLKEQIGIFLYKGPEKIADFGKFGPSRMAPFKRRGDVKKIVTPTSLKFANLKLLQNKLLLKNLHLNKSKMLGSGKGYKLIFKFASGKSLVFDNFAMKETKLIKLKQMKNIR